MIVTYQGGESFKISQGDLAISINPQTKVSADVTIFTSIGSDGQITSDRSGFVITGPGEYEIKDIFIKGYLTKEKDVYKTTYLITFEGMKLCFLGSLEHPEEIEDVDVLFVPIGTDSSSAYKVAVSIEPSVMIPMRFDDKNLAQFIKESGDKVEALDKFVVKKKDLEGKESAIILLKEE